MKKPKSEREKIKETVKKSTVRVIKEIAKSEGMLAAIGEGIAVVDRALRVLYENQVHKKMMGDHVGEYCYKAYAKKEGLCSGCPVTLTFEDGKVHSVQRELHSDTETRYLEITASPLKDLTGEIIAGIEVVRDVTERKQANQKLREREERCRLLFNNVSDAIFVHEVMPDASASGRFIEVNDRACHYLGYSREELLQMNVHQIDAQETLANVPAILRKLFEEGRATWEGIHVSKDGRKIPVEISNQLFELHGKPMILSAVRDITERKRSEEALKLESQLLDAATDSIFLLDLEGNLIHINEAAYKSRGYTKAELMAMNLKDFDTPERAKLIDLRMQEVMEKGEATFESAHCRKDGSIMPIEVHARIIEVGDKKLVLSVTRDIAERKQVEESLRKEKRFSDTMINSLPGIFYVFDENGHYILWNKNFETVSGYSSEEIGKMNPLDFFSGEDKKLVGEAIQEVLAKGEHYVEANLISKDGKSIPYYFTGLRFISDNRTYIIGMGIDITEHKQAEETLRISEERYRSLVENQTELVSRFKPDGTFVFVNDVYCHFFGKTKDDLIGKKWFPLPVDEDLTFVQEKLLTLSPTNPVVIIENRVVSSKGDIHWMKFVNKGFFDRHGDLLEIQSVGRDVTERKKAQKALKESEERFRDLFENANDLIQIVDAKGKYLYVNRKWCELLGFTEEETKRLNFADIVKKEQIPHCMEYFRRIANGESIEGMATIYISKDGREIYLEGNMSPSFKNGKFVSSRGIFRDVTERKKTEEALQASEEELHNSYFSQSAINMILSESLENIPLEEVLQKALNMILAIPWIAFESIGSISLVEHEADVLVMKAQSNLDEPLKKLCARVPFGKCLCGKAALSQKIEFADRIDKRHQICYEGMQPHGHYSVPILFSGKTLGVLTIYLKEGHIRDKEEEDFLRTIANTLAGIIMRKKAEERIEYLAYYDRLTGIPNRNLFIDRLKQGIARAERTSKIVAVLITNIDRFKSINDTYGAEIADKVLNEVAERLSTAVRKGDTVARLGNDEFGIALLDIANLDDVIPVMEKIIKYISYPLEIDSNEIALTFSTGISIYPHDNNNPQDLLKSAGLALGIAKKAGRKTYQFYTEDFNVKASEFLLMEKNLFNAVKNKEFLLHYQPYWEMTTQKMVGMEALIRWQSKDVGLVLPGKFIPVLEDTGMIIEVGEWILREAMRQVKEWQNNGYPVVPISVNLSLVQFRQKDLAKMVKSIMADCGFYPSLLTLEITESAFMQNIEFTRSVLMAMKELGCSVSIDDFGTGYSSLSYLKRFPVDNLKIDISFIREMAKDPDSASIVMAIINMAHTLNLKTIAEGIETEEQWKFLRLLRCDMGQGFYLSKPVPAEDVERFFKQQ